MKIIYFHGLGSTGTSDKSQALKDAFGAENVLTPDYPVDPDKTISQIERLVTPLKREGLVFVGTSLGGFWANYFGQRFQSKCVLVNPLLDPGVAFIDGAGTIVKNYVTGEETLMTAEMVKGFRSAEAEVGSMNPDLVTMFLARDDDVIDYKRTLAQLPEADIFVTDDGGHRYEKNWPNVVAFIQMII
jgi:predicted esterase YcpF (UPF0227 family)